MYEGVEAFSAPMRVTNESVAAFHTAPKLETVCDFTADELLAHTVTLETVEDLSIFTL
jgi:hypothetical protein